MELYLFRPDEYNRLYNCSLYDIESIPYAERRNPNLGYCLVTLSVIAEAAYIPCLVVLMKKEFQQFPCYKFMLILAIVDIVAVLIAGTVTGVLGIGGFVFCSAPNFIYIFGSILMSLWVFHSTISVLLAINRCLSVFHKRLSYIFFNGNKPYYYAVPAFFYALYFVFFTTSIEFTGLRFSWFFNPHYGYIDDPLQIYHGYAHAIHNGIIIIVTIGVYGCFGVILIQNWKRLENANNNTKIQERVFFQVLLMSFCTVTAALTYVVMNFKFAPDIFSVISTYMLFFIHSLPPLFYLCLNSSIKQRIFVMPLRVQGVQGAFTVTVF